MDADGNARAGLTSISPIVMKSRGYVSEATFGGARPFSISPLVRNRRRAPTYHPGMQRFAIPLSLLTSFAVGCADDGPDSTPGTTEADSSGSDSGSATDDESDDGASDSDPGS